MFRVKGSAKRNANFCLENNVIIYGWSSENFSTNGESAIQNIKKNYTSRAASMARNFNRIRKQDIVLMPLRGGVAIGKVNSDALYKEEWKSDDAANCFDVEWLAKWYNRKSLSSALQSSLKYGATFLNLWKYKEELGNLIKSGFKGLDEKFQESQSEKREEIINRISKHINSNKDLFFDDTEFEYFIMDLLQLEYPGLKTDKNNQRQEGKDGKDFTATIPVDIAGIEITLNVQVKQHEGYADIGGLFQIDKSDAEEEYTKNILVTVGEANGKMRKVAEEKDIVLLDNRDIAEMIINNFSNIEDKYKAKLKLVDDIDIIN